MRQRTQGDWQMNVIVFASRKGGTGKSTLAAHLAALNSRAARECLLIDADPQGSLTLWHRLRKTGGLPLQSGLTGLGETIANARLAGFEWVIVDTPPLISNEVTEAIAAATLVVIPARPSVFDLNAIKETITVAHIAHKPFAVVLNAVPPKRLGDDSRMVTLARRTLAGLGAPVWSGQITQRANLTLALAEGEGADEYEAQSAAAGEIAGLWVAIENSVKAIRGAYEGAAMHQRAA